jgi:hypothetical protein
MAIEDFPDSYDALALWFDAYERQNMYFDPANRILMDAMHQYVADRVPRVLRWPVTRAVDSLLDDPVRDAIGLSKPPAMIRLPTDLLLFLAGWRNRRRPGNDKPFFEFGKPVGYYTEPYDLDQVGPGDQGELARLFREQAGDDDADATGAEQVQANESRASERAGE